MNCLKFGAHTSVIAMVLVLGACGDGGGGGIASTPTPPAAPTNSSLETLSVSQSFTNNASTQTARFDLTTSNTVSGSSASGPLTIAYNPTGNTYTISTAGRSQSFASSDMTSSGQGQAVFAKTGAAGKDYLTLWAATFGGTGPRYVGRGMWQHNVISGNTQDTTLDFFTYGIESPAAAIPRAGTAAFATDVFGVTTKPGAQPRSFYGSGNFDVDFLTGNFVSNTPVHESELVSGAGVSGGGIQVTLAGSLSASDGTFSGYAAYGGGNSQSQGTVAGRFYGPGASELGAAFTTSGADGSSASGAVLGLQSANKESYDLALSNYVTSQLFSTTNAWVELQNNSQATATGSDNAQLTKEVDGSFSFSGARSDMAYGSIAASDQIAASAPNFTTYQKKSLNGFTTTVDFYKPGSANTELALTYTSFAHFNELLDLVNQANRFNIYTVYGIDSIPGIIAARTGTAHYSGVAYGTGIDTAANAVYNVKGTSSFDADFSAATLTGALALTGQSGANTQNYGTLSFATNIVNGFPAIGSLSKSGANWGTMTPRFYGPTGQEIGAVFQFIVPSGQPGAGTAVAGAAVAKGG